ncbi:MAG: hypothetical protein IJY63_04410 [Clostridia bacterium]|nr:hypothetical protein [Clostridia bacterium]MBQ8876768.1 hypothetical protein [Clostridia bacterium]
MKKVFKMAMGCVCALSVMMAVGCDKGGSSYTTQETLNGKTTEEKYTEIMATIDGQSENFTSLTKFDVHLDMTMQGATMGLDMDMSTTIKMDGDNFIENDYIDGGTFMGEQFGTMNLNVWYVGGVAYVDGTDSGNFEGQINNTKTKYTATIAQICDIAGLDQDELWNPIYDFSDTAFEDVKFNVGESDSYFEIIMKGEEAANYAEKLVALKGVNGDISIPQVNYKFMMDTEGNFEYVKIDYEMTMTATVQGQAVTYKYKYDGTITFSDVGTTVVAAPEGGETWRDITAYLPLS